MPRWQDKSAKGGSWQLASNITYVSQHRCRDHAVQAAKVADSVQWGLTWPVEVTLSSQAGPVQVRRRKPFCSASSDLGGEVGVWYPVAGSFSSTCTMLCDALLPCFVMRYRAMPCSNGLGQGNA